MIARIHKSMNEKDKGFTLIELLVVIIIIGILAAIAIPVFMNQRKKAVDSGIKSDLRTVANEIETYYTDYQKYPATTDVTATSATSNSFIIGTGTDATTIKLTAGNEIKYTLDTGGESYSIVGFNTKGTANSATKVFKYSSIDGGLRAGAPARSEERRVGKECPV